MEDQNEKPDAVTPVASDALFASIAAEWEDLPEHLERVTEQVRAIHEKLIEWGWGEVDREELDHATIAYSRACIDYECSEWLPFEVMPSWEDDLYCLLIDEEFWREKRDENFTGDDIAKMLRAREANDQGHTPTK